MTKDKNKQPENKIKPEISLIKSGAGAHLMNPSPSKGGASKPPPVKK